MRIAAALLLVVPAWSVARVTQHVDATRRQRARRYLGVALAMFVGWQIAATTGMVLAGAISAAFAEPPSPAPAAITALLTLRP